MHPERSFLKALAFGSLFTVGVLNSKDMEYLPGSGFERDVRTCVSITTQQAQAAGITAKNSPEYLETICREFVRDNPLNTPPNKPLVEALAWVLATIASGALTTREIIRGVLPIWRRLRRN